MMKLFAKALLGMAALLLAVLLATLIMLRRADSHAAPGGGTGGAPCMVATP